MKIITKSVQTLSHILRAKDSKQAQDKYLNWLIRFDIEDIYLKFVHQHLRVNSVINFAHFLSIFFSSFSHKDQANHPVTTDGLFVRVRAFPLSVIPGVPRMSGCWKNDRNTVCGRETMVLTRLPLSPSFGRLRTPPGGPEPPAAAAPPLK